MTQPRRPIATGILIAIFTFGLAPADAWAADEVQDLRRDVNRLRAEMLALQAALAETTELEYQRDLKITRALRADAPPATPVAPPPSVPAGGSEAAEEAREPARPATPAASGDGKRRSKSNKRRHRRSGRWRAKSPRASADR
jgi:hypothetical protein